MRAGPALGQADLWIVHPELVGNSEILSPTELDENARFLNAGAKLQHLAARVLTRKVLSHYTGTPARDWVFERDAFGRPSIAQPACFRDLHFNLSHTQGLVACLVASHPLIGVDVESESRDIRDLLEIADRFFSQSEANALRALPAKNQARRFREYWTLKESYVKARGEGLSLGLSRFSFHLDGGNIRFSCEPDFDRNSQSWQFQLIRPSETHVLATSICPIPPVAIQLNVRKVLSLGADGISFVNSSRLTTAE